jgi:hypothetical protein
MLHSVSSSSITMEQTGSVAIVRNSWQLVHYAGGTIKMLLPLMEQPGIFLGGYSGSLVPPSGNFSLPE